MQAGDLITTKARVAAHDQISVAVLQDLHDFVNDTAKQECLLQGENEVKRALKLIIGCTGTWTGTTTESFPLFCRASEVAVAPDATFISIPFCVGLAPQWPLGPSCLVPTRFTACCTIVQVLTRDDRRRVNYSIAIEPNSITHTCTLILRLPMSTENATRYCHLNGNWDNYTNYETCHHIGEAGPGFDAAVELPTYIYCLGYLISLLSLALAVFVFIRFKYVPRTLNDGQSIPIRFDSIL